MNMKTVMVIISTYNGAKHIVRQLESIFNQKRVLVKVFIRDDYSTDDTIKVIKEYMKKHENYDITLKEGKNEGYAKSFWDGLKMCDFADYYAFSDQDDVWKDNKLYKCVETMESDKDDVPKLTYCNMQRSDIELNRLDEQVQVLTPNKLTKRIVLTKTYNYGAATMINNQARELVCRCWPEVDNLPHDMWVGTVCYWFGKIYHVNEKLYYWIRYENSVTGSGTKLSGCIYRFKQSIKRKSYPNISYYILKYYNDLLEEDDKKFLKVVAEYKSDFKNKICLLLNPHFCRDSLKGTIILKLGVLMNWF